MQGCVAFLPFLRLTLRARKPSDIPEVPETLGDHLRARRRALGLLQKEAAVQLGVCQETVIHWEKGQTQPEIGLWPAVIRFLGYDPAPPPTTFAARLLAARRRLGLPRKEAALRLGVDDGTLGRWERGQGKPNPRLRARAERRLAGWRADSVLASTPSLHAAS